MGQTLTVSSSDRPHSYRNLHAWMVRLYRRPEIGQWIDFEQLRNGVAVLGRKSNDKELIVPYGPFEEDILGVS